MSNFVDVMAASASSLTYPQLRRDIRAGQLAPVYLLNGEEGYYIDELVKDFESLVPEDERDFNLYVLYAPESGVDTAMDICRGFPVMADRQVVILKEAQAIRSDALNKLHYYVSSPNPSTVFVICARGITVKSRDLVAAVKKNGVIFTSQKLKDREVAPAIAALVKEKGLNIEPKALAMMRDYVGADLSRLYNEIDKLSFILGKGAMITPEVIERNIGISKDYNNFELVSAVAALDYGRMMRIAYYFRSNPKNSPTTLTASALFNFFSNLLKCQFSRDKSPSALMGLLGLKWPVQFKDYEQGLKRYSARQSLQAISEIRRFDCMTKGIGSRRNEYDLLQELLYRLITLKGI